MKKYLLSSLVIFAFVAYSLKVRFSNASDLQVVLPTPNPASPSKTTSPNSNPPSTTTSGFKDGEYTGDVTDAFYGNVQVKAVIQGGKLTDVQFLQYPDDRRTSVEINSQATPILRQKAIQAQSAQVDIASGATQTSQAFIQSLETALNQAKK